MLYMQVILVLGGNSVRKRGGGGLSVSFWGTFHDDDHDDQDDGDDDHDDLAQHVATNELLYVVANTCRRLTLLDISYSDKVPYLLLFRFFSLIDYCII